MDHYQRGHGSQPRARRRTSLMAYTYRGWPDWLADDADDVELLENNQIDIALIGAAVDAGATTLNGQADGPVHLRSRRYNGGNEDATFHPMYNVDVSELVVVDMGDFTDYQKILDQVKLCVDNGVLPIVVGGDDSMSFFVLEACHSVVPKTKLMHYDAHADFSVILPGEDIDHANWVYAAIEHKLTRGVYYNGYRALGPVFDTTTHHHCNSTTQRYQEPLYLAVDIDVVDPSEAPGVGCPEAGGMTAANLIQRCFWLARVQDLMAVSFAEFLPLLDSDGQTAGVIDACIQAVCAGWVAKIHDAEKSLTGK